MLPLWSVDLCNFSYSLSTTLGHPSGQKCRILVFSSHKAFGIAQLLGLDCYGFSPPCGDKPPVPGLNEEASSQSFDPGVSFFDKKDNNYNGHWPCMI